MTLTLTQYLKIFIYVLIVVLLILLLLFIANICRSKPQLDSYHDTPKIYNNHKLDNTKFSLIILVIASCDTKYYINFIEYYWKPLIQYIETNRLSIKIYFLFGNKPRNIDINDSDMIISQTPENLIPGVLLKTIYGFRYINNNYRYEYILRTNLSSFFVINELVKTYKSLDKTNVYAGFIGNNKNKKFVSGAGFFLSKDMVEYLLSKEKKLDYNIIDDVAIGIVLQHKKMTPLPRYDVVNNTDFNKIVSEINNSGHYHLRLKTNNRLSDADFAKKLMIHYLGMNINSITSIVARSRSH